MSTPTYQKDVEGRYDSHDDDSDPGREPGDCRENKNFNISTVQETQSQYKYVNRNVNKLVNVPVNQSQYT